MCPSQSRVIPLAPITSPSPLQLIKSQVKVVSVVIVSPQFTDDKGPVPEGIEVVVVVDIVTVVVVVVGKVVVGTVVVVVFFPLPPPSPGSSFANAIIENNKNIDKTSNENKAIFLLIFHTPLSIVILGNPEKAGSSEGRVRAGCNKIINKTKMSTESNFFIFFTFY